MVCLKCGKKQQNTDHCLSCGSDLRVQLNSVSMKGEIEYVGFWMRVVSRVIDSILYGLGAFLSMIILGVLFDIDPNTMEEGAFDSFVFLTGLFLLWLYYALFESSPSQATPGKHILGMKVTDMQGEPLTFAKASGRFFASSLSYLTIVVFGFGYVMAAFTQKKQTLHDKVSGCLVVYK